MKKLFPFAVAALLCLWPIKPNAQPMIPGIGSPMIPNASSSGGSFPPSGCTTANGVIINNATPCSAQLTYDPSAGQLLLDSGVALGSTTALLINPTSASGLLLDAQVNGTSQWNVSAGGATVQLGSLTVNTGGASILTSPSAAKWQFGAANAASPVAQTISFQGASNAGTSGANATIVGSLAWGNAGGTTSGDIVFQTGVKQSAAQATATTALTIKGETQGSIFNTNNTGAHGNSGPFLVSDAYSGAQTMVAEFLAPSATLPVLGIGVGSASRNQGEIFFNYSGSGNAGNYIGFAIQAEPIGLTVGVGGLTAAIGAGFEVGGSGLTLTTGAIGQTKITASGTAPGAAGGKLELVCGTNAGSVKLIIAAGTSATAVTVIDNVGSGVTGC